MGPGRSPEVTDWQVPTCLGCQTDRPAVGGRSGPGRGPGPGRRRDPRPAALGRRTSDSQTPPQPRFLGRGVVGQTCIKPAHPTTRGPMRKRSSGITSSPSITCGEGENAREKHFSLPVGTDSLAYPRATLLECNMAQEGSYANSRKTVSRQLQI